MCNAKLCFPFGHAEACPNLAANQPIKRVDCKVISFQLDSENSALWVVETWGASRVSAEMRCERSTGSKNAVKLAFDWAAHTDFGVQLPLSHSEDQNSAWLYLLCEKTSVNPLRNPRKQRLFMTWLRFIALVIFLQLHSSSVTVVCTSAGTLKTADF